MQVATHVDIIKNLYLPTYKMYHNALETVLLFKMKEKLTFQFLSGRADGINNPSKRWENGPWPTKVTEKDYYNVLRVS